MDEQQLEFAISQYVDGTLDAAQRAALERIFDQDARAGAMLQEYVRLEAALKSALPVPEVRWEALHRHLSRGVVGGRASVPAPRVHAMADFWRGYGRLAAAACLAVAAMLAVRLYMHQPAPTSSAVIAEIIGPAVEAPAGSPVCTIEIGPQPQSKAQDGVVAMAPGRMVIASTYASAQDTPDSPY